MITISADSDEEEAALLAAHREDRIDLGGLDYVISRGRRTIAGRSRTTAVHYGGNGSSIGGWGGGGGGGGGTGPGFATGGPGGGGGGGNAYRVPDGLRWYEYNPTGGPSWVERHGHLPDEPCPPTCRGNPAGPR